MSKKMKTVSKKAQKPAPRKTVQKSKPASGKSTVKKATQKPSNNKPKSAKPANKPVLNKKAQSSPKKSVTAKSNKASKPLKVSKPIKASKTKTTAPVAKLKTVASKSSGTKHSNNKVVSKAPLKKVAPVKPVAKVATKPASKVVTKPVAKVAAKPVAAKPIAKAAPPEKKTVKPEPVKKPSVAAPVTKKTVPAVAAELKKSEVATAPSKKDERTVLAITNTIPETKRPEISASRIATISSSITNPIRRNDSYSVKTEKEPNGKFELEFVIHASAEMLYEFLSTPSGLSEWFCDDLNIRNGIYTFIWEDQLQQARLLKTIELQLVRFQWVEKTDGSYFEFRIQRDDLTNDISVIITDFAETVSERESSKLLWHSQFEKLRHVIGAIF